MLFRLRNEVDLKIFPKSSQYCIQKKKEKEKNDLLYTMFSFEPNNFR